ncbi:hypothetical protein B0H63DRAFT_560686 [Podospora didyma]|uniref:Uncharacterized protein n=1 Tax=Podospora didyma TaxID=330526 RepID=A0AAE0TV83_9PEZI|nr:hypothetical protein B0H63DRAFT_560686 [Podospora didyma]
MAVDYLFLLESYLAIFFILTLGPRTVAFIRDVVISYVLDAIFFVLDWLILKKQEALQALVLIGVIFPPFFTYSLSAQLDDYYPGTRYILWFLVGVWFTGIVTVNIDNNYWLVLLVITLLVSEDLAREEGAFLIPSIKRGMDPMANVLRWPAWYEVVDRWGLSHVFNAVGRVVIWVMPDGHWNYDRACRPSACSIPYHRALIGNYGWLWY